MSKRSKLIGHRAVRLRDVNGKRMYRVPVYIQVNGGAWPGHPDVLATTDGMVRVIARNAVDAVNFVRDEIGHLVEAPTELTAVGPKGGQVHRFIGWESMIEYQMIRASTMARDRRAGLERSAHVNNKQTTQETSK